jgi:hypothetical protein
VLKVVKNHIKPTINRSKKFNLPLEFGDPWEGLGIETPLPNMHSLAQTMRNKPHLRRNKINIFKMLRCELATITTSITTQVQELSLERAEGDKKSSKTNCSRVIEISAHRWSLGAFGRVWATRPSSLVCIAWPRP